MRYLASYVVVLVVGIAIGAALPAAASQQRTGRQERIDPYRLCIAIKELQGVIHLNNSLDPRPYLVHRIRRCPLGG
jgi:hypothetical protein